MCGIAGEVNLKKNLKVNKSFLKILSHRGPHNFTHCKVNQNLCFYHTRLKIIDLSNKSNQPMFSENLRYVISYNGELYNYKQIKLDLTKKGYEFTTTGDTEVFLKGFIEYGKNFFEKVNGIFAVSIFDKKEKILYLARDFIGVKPLYYTYSDNKLIFASELKAIAQNFGGKVYLNKKVLNEFLYYKYISGEETLVKNIYKFDPGKLYTVNLREKKIKFKTFTYYKFKETKDKESLEENTNKIKELLTNSVRLQLQSDANLGIQLSGGLDSTLITEISSKESRINNLYFSSFKNFEKDEFKYANYVAKKLNLQFKRIELSKNYFDKCFSKSIYYLDEPLNHPHSIAIYQISENAKKNVSVMLAGEGADEIFFGYERYNKISSRSKEDEYIKNGAFLRNSSDLYLYSLFGSKKYDNPHVNRKEILKRINVENKIKKFQLFETQTHLQSLLLRSDKMMMANSIEARVPFLDKDLFNYSINLKDQIKLHSEKKLILKNLLKKFNYPKKFINRKKVGYIIPYNNWIQKQSSFKKEILDENLLNLFDRKNLNLLANNLEKNKNIYSNAKIYWLLTNLNQFINIFKLNI